MNDDIFSEIFRWFYSYADSFLSGQEEADGNYIMKRNHSTLVCETIVRIGRSIPLSDHDLNLARITGILHDTGRFEQFRKYGTFSDKISEDHAALGVRVLQDEGVLHSLGEEDLSSVLTAVKYHNRASVPDVNDERTALLCRLIRDADKADIYRVVTEYYENSAQERNSVLELGLPDSPVISQGVIDAIRAKKIVSLGDVVNINDLKFLQAGWVFDINFGETLNIIRERGFLERIISSLPESPAKEELGEIILNQLTSPVLCSHYS